MPPSSTGFFVALLVFGAACDLRALRLGDEADEAMVTAPMQGCDPTRSDCGSGQACLPDCNQQAFACAPRPRGEAEQGAVCSHQGDCKPGFACAADSTGTAGTRCLKFCGRSTDCPAGHRCATRSSPCDPGDPSSSLVITVCEPGRERRDGGR